MALTEEWKVKVENLNDIPAGYDYNNQDVGLISETPIKNLNFPNSPCKSILQLHEHFNDENDPTKLSIMHINMRFIYGNKKFDRFRTNLCLMKRIPDIICISETWFLSTEDLKNHMIPNYFLYMCNV